MLLKTDSSSSAPAPADSHNLIRTTQANLR